MVVDDANLAGRRQDRSVILTFAGFAVAAFVVFYALHRRGAWEPPGPPERFEQVVVEGSITFNGDPVSYGWIAFYPKFGTVGDHVVYTIDAAGKFQGDDAPLGAVYVRYTPSNDVRRSLSTKAPGFGRALDRFASVGSPLTWRTQPGGINRLKLDLREAATQPELDLNLK